MFTFLFLKLPVSELPKKFPEFFFQRKASLPFHKNPPFLNISSRMNLAHVFLTYLFDVHFNIILKSVPNPSMWPHSFTFSNQISISISPLPRTCQIPRPNYSFFHRSKHTWFRSQWPRGLRRRSAAARLLRLWVRIPPWAWMSICCDRCVLSSTGLCDELITRPEESYRLWCVVICDLETS